MSYSESGPDSNFAINSESNFYSSSESNSESDFNLVFINLEICIFFTLYLHSSEKTCRWFFFIYLNNRINSYASNASVMQIFF